MKSLGVEYIEVVFKVAITPVIADHFNGMSLLLKMVDHLSGPGRMPGSRTRYIIYDFGQDRLLTIEFQKFQKFDILAMNLGLFPFNIKCQQNYQPCDRRQNYRTF
jgi:hypothetical protein